MSEDGIHISNEVALRLVTGAKINKPVRSAAIRHLLTGCVKCMDKIRELAKQESPDYTDVMRRLGLSFVVAQGRVQEERKHARELWPELERQPPEVRLYMVKNMEEFRTWGIYEVALETVRKVSRNDPLGAVDLAHLAVAIADLLDPSLYNDERRADMKGSALIALGNSKRIAADFEGARLALDEAESCLEAGSGDLYERANLISIRSSLASDLGDLEQASEMLRPAINLARKLQDEKFEGKLILKQSSSIGFVNPALGLELANKGMRLLESEHETHLELTGRYLIAYWTNDLGDSEGALEAIQPYRYLFEKFGDIFWRGRLLNLEGRIANMERRLERAELFYRQLVDLYGEADFEFDLALACLDLAEVLTAQGKYNDSISILQGTYPILQKWNLHGDILRSWLILVEAIKRHSIQANAFEELSMVLRRKWHRKEGA